MQYLHTMVRVSNLEASLAFYCDALGMVELSRKDSESGRFTLIFLAAKNDVDLASNRNGPVLELTYNWDPEVYSGGRNFGHLAYRVDNIYATCQHLVDLGVVINRPPRDGYMAFIKSPDGISVELLQSGSPLAPQDPWQSMQNNGSW